MDLKILFTYSNNQPTYSNNQPTSKRMINNVSWKIRIMYLPFFFTSVFNYLDVKTYMWPSQQTSTYIVFKIAHLVMPSQIWVSSTPDAFGVMCVQYNGGAQYYHDAV